MVNWYRPRRLTNRRRQSTRNAGASELISDVLTTPPDETSGVSVKTTYLGGHCVSRD